MPSAPGAPWLASTRFTAWFRFSRVNICAHTVSPPPSDVCSLIPGDGSALVWLCRASPFASRLGSRLSGRSFLPSMFISRNAQVFILLYVRPFPLDGAVLWPRLTPGTSAAPHDAGCHLRWLGTRSPQISTLTFPAHWLHLPLCPLMTWTS